MKETSNPKACSAVTFSHPINTKEAIGELVTAFLPQKRKWKPTLKFSMTT